MKKICTFILIFVGLQSLKAQQIFTVTDSFPATVNGLTAGYTITEASEKEVGSKGNFSRYKIKFYVTNNSSQAIVIMHKPGFNLFGSGVVFDAVVQFKCSNATGARLTNKEATVRAKPCYVDAIVEDKECGSDKVTQNKRNVNIGYWIKPNETIATNSIMIVPLNEKPIVSVTFYPNTGNTIASIGYNNTANPINNGFYRIKNFQSNYYLNNQNGTSLNCSNIDFDWWSAQWELLPINGTNYYNIRNRWKGNFLCVGNMEMLSADGNTTQSQWFIEDAGNNTYTIKNVMSNQKLTYQNGMLTLSNVFGLSDNVKWLIEQ